MSLFAFMIDLSLTRSSLSFSCIISTELTNTTTATNYGLEGDIKDKESTPAFEGGFNGPFLELIPDRSTNIPKLILTKTHCGGIAASRNPTTYIETNPSHRLHIPHGTVKNL